MMKALTTLTAAGVLAIAAVAAPQQAEARCRGCAVGAGVIGGLAAGAIIGGALSGPHYGYYYGPGPVYYGPGCYWTRERYWNGYRWRSHRVRVCR